MAEMPDVATLTTISSDWGNDIRDRTIQRYSSVSNRTTEHPTPTEGDLAYLEDSNTVWVYDGANWVNIAAPVQTADIADGAVTGDKLDGTVTTAFEVSGADGTASVALTGTFANMTTVNLTIPASWGSWKCETYATFSHIGNLGQGQFTVRFSIDGTATGQQADLRGEGARQSGAAGGHRTGITTTGSRTIAFQAIQDSGFVVTLADIYMYARAVRTS